MLKREGKGNAHNSVFFAPSVFVSCVYSVSVLLPSCASATNCAELDTEKKARDVHPGSHPRRADGVLLGVFLSLALALAGPAQSELWKAATVGTANAGGGVGPGPTAHFPLPK